MHEADAEYDTVETPPVAKSGSKRTNLALELFNVVVVALLRRGFGGDGGLVDESIVIGGVMGRRGCRIVVLQHTNN